MCVCWPRRGEIRREKGRFGLDVWWCGKPSETPFVRKTFKLPRHGGGNLSHISVKGRRGKPPEEHCSMQAPPVTSPPKAKHSYGPW
eukprot:364902-Chlamydomonas_euryale.AAC.29